jgi:hypothetical protein
MNNYDKATDGAERWIAFKKSGTMKFPNLPNMEFKGRYISE